MITNSRHAPRRSAYPKPGAAPRKLVFRNKTNDGELTLPTLLNIRQTVALNSSSAIGGRFQRTQ